MIRCRNVRVRAVGVAGVRKLAARDGLGLSSSPAVQSAPSAKLQSPGPGQAKRQRSGYRAAVALAAWAALSSTICAACAWVIRSAIGIGARLSACGAVQ